MTRRRPFTRSVVLLTIPAVLALGALPAARARADDPAPVPAPVPAPAPPSALVPAARPALLLPDTELPVTQILGALASATGATISWSESDKGITYKKVVGAGSVFARNPDRLVDAVRALLAHDDIVLVPYGPADARMYRAMDARTLSGQFIAKMQPDVIEVTDDLIPTLLGQGGRYVTTTIRVRNLTELRDARTALVRLVTQNNMGNVQEVPAGRAFIVTDFAPNVAAIYRMIRLLDVAPPQLEAGRTSTTFFKLSHRNAAHVAMLLEKLFVPAPAAPASGATRPPVETPAPASPSSPPPRIAYEQETNTVVVIATPETTEAIRNVVLTLDAAPPK